MSAICDLNPVLRILKYAVMLQAYKQREPGKLVSNQVNTVLLLGYVIAYFKAAILSLFSLLGISLV